MGSIASTARRSDEPPVDAAGLQLPVVCASGSEADPFHRQAVEFLMDTIPRADLLVVEGAGHGVHLTHPTITAGIVRSLRWRVR